MSAIRGKDTKPELIIRKRLWARGYRYRLHHKIMGRPDLVFSGSRVAVFIDGDFWHGNAHRVRGLNSLEDMFPTRAEWWCAKIRRNMSRDTEVTASLEDDGWRVLRFWSSRVLEDPDAVADQIAAAVDAASEKV